jgi:hypothetical protein
MCVYFHLYFYRILSSEKKKKRIKRIPHSAFQVTYMRALSGETSALSEEADLQLLRGFQANLTYSILDQLEAAFGKRMMPETVGKI